MNTLNLIESCMLYGYCIVITHCCASFTYSCTWFSKLNCLIGCLTVELFKKIHPNPLQLIPNLGCLCGIIKKYPRNLRQLLPNLGRGVGWQTTTIVERSISYSYFWCIPIIICHGIKTKKNLLFRNSPVYVCETCKRWCIEERRGLFSDELNISEGTNHKKQTCFLFLGHEKETHKKRMLMNKCSRPFIHFDRT